MKRFYKLVSTHKEADGYAIHLDGKPVKTQLRQNLIAPNEALANALVREWAAQEEQIKPDTMPLTQILNTLLDRVAQERDVMSAAILKYLDTDLLCYRMDEDPLGQAPAQSGIWDPWLDWFEKRFGVRLLTTATLAALAQPAAAHEAVKEAVHAMNDAHFTILQLVTPLSGSLVLALAFVEGTITPAQVFEAARIEEAFKDKMYNAEKYGGDPMQEKKDTAMKIDLEASAIFLSSLSSRCSGESRG